MARNLSSAVRLMSARISALLLVSALALPSSARAQDTRDPVTRFFQGLFTTESAPAPADVKPAPRGMAEPGRKAALA